MTTKKTICAKTNLGKVACLETAAGIAGPLLTPNPKGTAYRLDAVNPQHRDQARAGGIVSPPTFNHCPGWGSNRDFLQRRKNEHN